MAPALSFSTTPSSSDTTESTTGKLLSVFSSSATTIVTIQAKTYPQITAVLSTDGPNITTTVRILIFITTTPHAIRHTENPTVDTSLLTKRAFHTTPPEHRTGACPLVM
ncbi:hypothetical protein EYF80_013843 [Liparis tanakae]|uniref:Uncharacterized protein n=1 Tax=Liparis tanakae TaxID=230148 RepID=A0A4Z2IFJ1_9TELE|nr:hypothetical protein EYF80_013843 [Liparis tanakae]